MTGRLVALVLLIESFSAWSPAAAVDLLADRDQPVPSQAEMQSAGPAPGATAVQVSTLVEMIKQRSVTVTDGWPPIGASFSGDTVRLSTMRPEPLLPNTLVQYFDRWHCAARLQLLLDYASWQLALEHPRVYGGPRAAEERQLDRDADNRISAIVRDTGDEDAWKPFVAVYADLHREITERALEYRAKTGSDDPFDMMVAIGIDELARSRLDGVIQSVPMGPEVVAHEMLRLLEATRTITLGVSASHPTASDLFHACGTGVDSDVVLNSEHPLAPTLSRTSRADDQDKAAQTVQRTYRKLVTAYRSWAVQHQRRPRRSSWSV